MRFNSRHVLQGSAAFRHQRTNSAALREGDGSDLGLASSVAEDLLEDVVGVGERGAFEGDAEFYLHREGGTRGVANFIEEAGVEV